MVAIFSGELTSILLAELSQSNLNLSAVRATTKRRCR
jgi:hypothetical protein